MAVGRLTGKWILEVLQTSFPDGVLRRALLDQFAQILVSGRARPGAKGRLARRIYARLAMLQRQGRITQELGIVRLSGRGRGVAPGQAPPVLGPLLRKKQFLALLAEDRSTEHPDAPRLRAARWEFLAAAIEAGWTLLQAADALGLPAPRAAAILAEAPPRKGA